jgi:hypothetical protein
MYLELKRFPFFIFYFSTFLGIEILNIFELIMLEYVILNRIMFLVNAQMVLLLLSKSEVPSQFAANICPIIFQHPVALMYHSFAHFRLLCNTTRSVSLCFQMSLKSHLIATCFGLTRPSSGNCSPIETAALHPFVCQCIPCYCISSFAIKCVCLGMNTLSSLCVIFILRRPCCVMYVYC